MQLYSAIHVLRATPPTEIVSNPRAHEGRAFTDIIIHVAGEHLGCDVWLMWLFTVEITQKATLFPCIMSVPSLEHRVQHTHEMQHEPKGCGSP